MLTFSQSDALQAACALAISSFSSSASPLIIKEEVNKTLNSMLKNPINSKKPRPIGWRLRRTHHTKSVNFFVAMNQSFKKRNKSLVPTLENIMGISIKESTKPLKSSDDLFISDISQVVRYKFEKMEITDVDSLPFPECPHLVISETSESSSVVSSNASSPFLYSDSATDILPFPTNTTFSSPRKRSRPCHVSSPRKRSRPSRVQSSVISAATIQQSYVISVATIQQSVLDHLDGFLAFKKRFPLFDFQFTVTSLQGLASKNSIDVWVYSLTLESQVDFSNMAMRITQVLLAKSWTRQIK
jgi:hypothetical protein